MSETTGTKYVKIYLVYSHVKYSVDRHYLSIKSIFYALRIKRMYTFY
jgi:hypothetical protein